MPVNIKGKGLQAIKNRDVQSQLNRYQTEFHKIISQYEILDMDFTIADVKGKLDLAFKKVSSRKTFFDFYDEFVKEKKMNRDWSPATITRYANIKTILENFEKSKGYKLSFNSINSTFHSEFTDYCMGTLKHINNTYARNLGLVKTFLFWALDKNYTYNDEFKKFKKKERVITNQVVLDKEDLEKLMKHQFKLKSLERVRDVFVFSAVTGMRFGELKYVTKTNITNNTFHLKEEKGSEKEMRSIPLSKVAIHILEKYDYKLPIIANQKHNEYIKDVFEDAGFKHIVQKITTRGKEVIREDMLFYDRVSSHTARRTFITMMKREGKSDKLISKITGHRDMKTLNSYYQVDSDEKKEAVNAVFDIHF
ncbi:putative integrase [Flavobacteria bacterium BBFL7]|nr:putative integrase [Flavobacteria bacterium BBFL7]